MHNVFTKLTTEKGIIYLNPRTCKMFHTPELITEDDGKYTVSTNRNRPILYKTIPTEIKFYLGSACNYRCSYCRQWEHSKLEHYTDDQIKHIANMLKSLIHSNTTNVPTTIQWWGGEPLLYIDDIMKIYELLPTGTLQSFTSNGSLLTPDITNWLIKTNSTFILSHDGPGQHLRGKNPLDDTIVYKCLKRLSANKKNRYQFMISSILHKDNLNINDTYKYHQEYFGNNVIMTKIELVIPYHEAADIVSHSLDDSDIIESLYKGFIDLDNDNLLMNIKSVEQDVHEFYDQHVNPNFCLDMCDIKCGTASETSICLDANGKLYPCQVYGGTDITIGKIQDLRINIGDVSLPRTMWNTTNCDCKNCAVVSLCRGVCPWLDEKFISSNCRNRKAVYTATLKYIFYKLGYPILNIEQVEL